MSSRKLRRERQYRGDRAIGWAKSQRRSRGGMTLEEPGFALLVGIDSGQRTHQICVLDASGKVLKECELEHDAGALHKLVDWLVERTGGDPSRVGVAIEVPHGVIVETLVERGLAVFAINPKQLDRF